MGLAIIVIVIAAILISLVVSVKRHFWDLYAVCYDAISVLIPYRQMMADLVNSMNLQSGKTIKVLVLGCGTGNFEKLALTEAKKIGTRIEIVGADFSTSMLKKARKKNQSLNVSYVQADISKPLSWQDQEFDVIIFCNTLYVFRDIAGIIAEATRVLKMNGKIIISDPKPNSSFLVIFWSHLLSGGVIKFFGRIGTLIISVVLIPELLLVAVANMVIYIWGKNGVYIFRDSTDWLSLPGEISLTDTYCGQNWLIVNQKKERR